MKKQAIALGLIVLSAAASCSRKTVTAVSEDSSYKRLSELHTTANTRELLQSHSEITLENPRLEIVRRVRGDTSVAMVVVGDRLVAADSRQSQSDAKAAVAVRDSAETDVRLRTHAETHVQPSFRSWLCLLIASAAAFIYLSWRGIRPRR